MHVAVSPYHLTTREPPAMAALLLAGAVITMVPAPPSARRGLTVDRDAARGAAGEAPGYADLLESWRWAAELFRERVAVSAPTAPAPRAVPPGRSESRRCRPPSLSPVARACAASG